MLRYFILTFFLLLPTVCYGTLVVAEPGDFLGDSSNPTGSEDLGVLSDPIVRITGSIAGGPDKVDAWTFTVPAGALLTGINVLASGFDGDLDWVDLYSGVYLGANPVVVSGNELSERLLVANYGLPIPLGAGTYKLTAISEENAAYAIEIVSSFAQAVSVPEPSALLLGGALSALLAGAYLVRRKRVA